MTIENQTPSFSILIVDDEAQNIKLLGSILKENGYEVEFAMDGENALAWLTSKPFDLVLLDVMMPVMDGYEVCRAIKSQLPLKHIPVLFLTAKTGTENIVKGFEVGGSDYITKPFNSPELLARVKIHVEMKILKGLLSICSCCKDIRDGQGIWMRIEAYIQSHSFARFSHGLCPKCSHKLYGNEDWYKQK